MGRKNIIVAQQTIDDLERDLQVEPFTLKKLTSDTSKFESKMDIDTQNHMASLQRQLEQLKELQHAFHRLRLAVRDFLKNKTNYYTCIIIHTCSLFIAILLG